MLKKKGLGTLIACGLILNVFILNERVFATQTNSIINKNKIQDKISIKSILPSDEDITKMPETELLDEIKKYDSEIIDMIENSHIIDNQISIIEKQIESIEKQINAYSQKNNKIEEEIRIKKNDLNKIKALLNLPSIYLTENNRKDIINTFNKIDKNKNINKIFSENIDTLTANSRYKEKYLKEVEELKKYLDESSIKINDVKQKINLRIEELNNRNRNTINNNPYLNQGTDVSIPDSMEVSELAKNIINITSSQMGVPYLWGGVTPKGFDCSGLMYYSFGKAGISIPRTAREQQKYAEKIEYKDLVPGDLVFWKTPATHVAIYIGEGKIIEAPRTGLNVRSRYIKSTERGINYGRILR